MANQQERNYRRLVAETQARFARQMLQFDRIDYMNLKTALDRTVEVGRMCEYPLVEDHWLPDDDARWNPVSRQIVIRREVFEDMMDGSPHHRFTIAHELGHCWLAHKFTRNRKIGSKVEFGRQRQIDEQEANTFASQFLAPSHLVRPGQTVCQIAATFGMSRRAAQLRLAEI